jgi:hypothetical protein
LNYYAGKAVQGAAGVPRTDARAWVAQKADTALRYIVLDDNRGCAYCHYGTGRQGGFDLSKTLPAAGEPAVDKSAHFIAPVKLQARFLPHARFDHSAHSGMTCGDCHQRRAAESKVTLANWGEARLTATVPEPLDIPSIGNCLTCHGGEGAATRAESTCVTCHVFHRTEFGPMRGEAAMTQ